MIREKSLRAMAFVLSLVLLLTCSHPSDYVYAASEQTAGGSGGSSSAVEYSDERITHNYAIGAAIVFLTQFPV